MNNQLKEKLTQIIEANFSKSESEVLINLVKERDELNSENTSLRNQIKEAIDKINSKDKQLNELKYERDTYKGRAEIKEKEAEEHKKLHDEMKKTYVELELKVTKESLNNIYKLAKIAFRSPKKITEFNENIPSTTYDYNTGRATGSYTNSYPVKKVESEE